MDLSVISRCFLGNNCKGSLYTYINKMSHFDLDFLTVITDRNTS